MLYDAALSSDPHSEVGHPSAMRDVGSAVDDDSSVFTFPRYSTRSSTRDTLLTNPLGQLHACIHTDGELIIETMQKHTLDSFLNKLCVKQMFGQLLVSDYFSTRLSFLARE